MLNTVKLKNGFPCVNWPGPMKTRKNSITYTITKIKILEPFKKIHSNFFRFTLDIYGL